MNKIKKFFIIIFASIVFLSLGQISLCNSLPDKGRRIEEIEEEIQILEEENQKLSTEISKNGSLIRVKEKAKETGFKKPLVVYLKENAKIAFELE